MAIENPSVLYLEQSLSPEQKTVVCENIGAVRTIAGKGLSTEDFTTAEKNKLSDVESGAEANVIEEITVNGTAVTPVNKSVEITIPNDVFQATYGVTTYNEIAAAVNSGRWITCLNGERLATFAYVGADNYEFNYHRSHAGNVDEMFVYKVDSHDTWTSATRTLVPKFDGNVDGLVPANGASATKYLKGDGTWDTPTDTTYSVFSTSADGLVPASEGTGETGKFLKGDGTWDTPTDTTYATFDTTTDGLVPKANGTGDTGKFLKGDGSWATPTDTTYGVFSTSADGLVPASDGTGETGKFLKGDGTWATPTDTTYSTFNTTTDGLVPKANGTGDTGKFLKGDGSWATPTDTTYSGGNGIDITGTVLSVDIATSGSGLEFSSSKLKVNGNASQAIEVGSSGVGIKLATDSGLEFSSGLKIKTDGTTIHTNASGALEVIGGGGGTTYTGGDGIDISAQDVISVKTDGTTIHANASGQLEVIGGGGGTTYTAGDGIDITSGTISANIDTDAGLTFDSSNPKKIQVNAGTNIGFNSSTGALDVPTVSASTGGTGGTNGVMLATDKEKLDSATVAVQLEGALAPLTPSSGVATIPNAVATGETGATNGLMTADDKKSLGTAVQYKVNPLESGTPVLLAQQMYVVESDAQIISIAGQSGEIQGKGTIFFRVGV